MIPTGSSPVIHTRGSCPGSVSNLELEKDMEENWTSIRMTRSRKDPISGLPAYARGTRHLLGFSSHAIPGFAIDLSMMDTEKLIEKIPGTGP